MEKMLSSWRENGNLSINGAWVLYVCQKQISRWKVTMSLWDLARENERVSRATSVKSNRDAWKPSRLALIGRLYIDFQQENGELNYPQKRVNLLCRARAFSTIKSTSPSMLANIRLKLGTYLFGNVYEQKFTYESLRCSKVIK